VPKITIKVEPKSKDNIGWDVFLTSWKPSEESQTVHTLKWRDPGDGTFSADSGDLPAGVYRLITSVKGVGRKVSVTVVGKPAVLDPAGSEWPMTVEVDGAIETQKDSIWYFQL
jgi:hypothetical protein